MFASRFVVSRLGTMIPVAAAAILVVVVMSGCAGGNVMPTKNGEKKVATFPPHPGKIKMVDLSSGKSWEVPVADVPERQRFVYLRDDVETSDPDEATERVPIVEIQMLPLDANGNVVPKDKAVTIRIKEIGPDQRPLRSTSMVKP